VGSAEKAAAVKATFDSSALASAGASYQVSAPPSAGVAAVAAPDVTTAPAMNANGAPAPAAVSRTYKWSAEKGADGLVTFDGSVPTDKLKRFLLTDAGGKSLDNSTVAGGAPADFNGGALNGLQALLKLQSGRLAFADGHWSLDGVAAATNGPASVRAALAEIDTHNWKFDIQIAPQASAATAKSPAPASPVPLAPALPAPSVAAAAPAAGHSPTAAASASTTSPASLPSSTAAATTGGPSTPTPLAPAPAASSSTSASAAAPGTAAPKAAAGTPPPASVAAPTAPPSETSTTAAAPAAAAPTAPSTTSTANTALPSPAVTQPSPTASPAATAESSAPAAPLGTSGSTAPAVATPATPPGSTAAPASPPPYTFAAVKGADGATVMTGDVPTAQIKGYFGVVATDVSTSGLNVVTGAPASFVGDALKGLDALDELATGELHFDGKAWSIKGQAKTPTAQAAAKAAIASLADAGNWTAAIEGPPPLEVCRQSVASFDALNAVTFTSGTHLSAASGPALDALAADLAQCPKARVDVEGNTDSDGDANANMALSVARAEAVVAELAKRGVDPDRLYAIGYGETLPLVPNTTAKNKALNRRIGIEVEDGKNK